VDAKLAITKHKRWRTVLWRSHLDEIEPIWEPVLLDWVELDEVPDFHESVATVAQRLRDLRLDRPMQRV